jgi:hypothetical protein
MNAIHIGTEVNEATRKELTLFIADVFSKGNETRMSGKTIRFALGMFTEVFTPKNISISNCQFTVLPDGAEEQEDCECS